MDGVQIIDKIAEGFSLDIYYLTDSMKEYYGVTGKNSIIIMESFGVDD